ncbi:hypothetical protein HHX47_DHR2001196 [Lentinula edodes]|nr:hypothetical protein HHX47_DHR2001196 [Lentinula edodes]
MSTTISLAQLTPQRLKLEGLQPIDALPDSTLPTRLGRHDRVQTRCGYEGLTVRLEDRMGVYQSQIYIPPSLSVFIITPHSPVESHYSALTSNCILYCFFHCLPPPSLL